MLKKDEVIQEAKTFIVPPCTSYETRISIHSSLGVGNNLGLGTKTEFFVTLLCIWVSCKFSAPPSRAHGLAMQKHRTAPKGRYCMVKKNYANPWERVPHLSALDVCSRRGAIGLQIHVYLTLPCHSSGNFAKITQITQFYVIRHQQVTTTSQNNSTQ